MMDDPKEKEEHDVNFVDGVQSTSSHAIWECSCGEEWISTEVLPCSKDGE